jgi:predicted Ser/Thr protein kinase
VDANRGLVEFTDILKRPVESFKYLLNTCETSTVNLGHVVIFLDTVFMASTNDRQLEAFREHPEFYSFKSRLEFIRVPYLLRYSDEEKIYLKTAEDLKGEKELMPHTCRSLALWAILSRIKKPLTKNKSAMLVRLLEALTPLEKAYLYDSGAIPERLIDEERKELKSHLEELYSEHQNHIYYEGLLGASARELKVVLQMAAQNETYPTLGPNAVFAELRKLVKRVADFDYLRQEPVTGGYHDFESFISVVHDEWLNWVDQELRGVLKLHRPDQLEEYLSSYFKQVISFVRGEKVRNRMTGKNEDADESFMNTFEDMVEADTERGEFRKNLISRLGAWSIENKEQSKEKIIYSEVFPQLVEKLKKYFHKQDTQKLAAMGKVFLEVQNFEELEHKNESSLSESEALALQAFHGLQKQFNYGALGAKEALMELMKVRYR